MKNKKIDKVRFPVYKEIVYKLVEECEKAGFYVHNEPSYGFRIFINKQDYDNEFKPQIYDGAFIHITDLSIKIQKYHRLLDGGLNAFTGWKELCSYDFNERTKADCIGSISYYLTHKNENCYPEIFYKMLLRYDKIREIAKDFE